MWVHCMCVLSPVTPHSLSPPASTHDHTWVPLQPHDACPLLFFRGFCKDVIEEGALQSNAQYIALVLVLVATVTPGGM